MAAPPRRFAVCLVSGALVLVGASPPQSGAQDRMAPGPPHESNVVVGEAPPTRFSLQSIDAETYALAERGERPLLLLFFRGTW